MGGGGPSGKADYPSYMTTFHLNMLAAFEVIHPTANPYKDLLAYNPASTIIALGVSLTAFVGYFTSIGTTLSGFKSMWSEQLTTVSQGITGSAVTSLDLSRVFAFEGKMRDINAVQTSSFSLGRAKIYSNILAEMGGLILNNVNTAVNSIIEYSKQLRSQFILQMDYSRVLIIACKDQSNFQIEIDAEEVKWPFFEFREAGALLGSIGSIASVQPGFALNNQAIFMSGNAGILASALTGGEAVSGAVAAIAAGIGGYMYAKDWDKALWGLG